MRSQLLRSQEGISVLGLFFVGLFFAGPPAHASRWLASSPSQRRRVLRLSIAHACAGAVQRCDMCGFAFAAVSEQSLVFRFSHTCLSPCGSRPSILSSSFLSSFDRLSSVVRRLLLPSLLPCIARRPASLHLVVAVTKPVVLAALCVRLLRVCGLVQCAPLLCVRSLFNDRALRACFVLITTSAIGGTHRSAVRLAWLSRCATAVGAHLYRHAVVAVMHTRLPRSDLSVQIVASF